MKLLYNEQHRGERMSTLGKKIKARRKEMKLTLKELAGDDFSYSLLSQIENDKANPSMETLQKLAEKLQLVASELLNPVDIELYKQLLIENERKFVMPYDRDPKVDRAILESIQPHIEHFTYRYYEEARLCELFCMSSYYVTNELNELLMNRAIDYYRQSGAIQHLYKAQLFVINYYFAQKEYEESHRKIKELLLKLPQEEYLLDTKTILDCLFLKSMLESAVGNYGESLQAIDKCFTIAHEQSFYARFDRMLQSRTLLTIQLNDEIEVQQQLQAFKRYVDFTENVYNEAHYMYTYLHVENRLNEKPTIVEEARSYIEAHDEEEYGPLSVIFNQEIGYAYWKQGDYEKALDELKPFDIPPYLIHPLDRAAGLEILAIRAYCYEMLGDRASAVEEISQCHQQMKKFPPSTYKQHVDEIYKDIMRL